MRLLTLTAVLALVAAPVLAGPDRAGMRGMMMPAFDFDAADADGDGAITREEFAAYVEAQREAMRDRMLERHAAAIMEAGDADGDGALSLEELRAGLAAVHAERMERRGEWRERRAERRAEGRADRAERLAEAGERPRGWRGHRGMRRAERRAEGRAERAERRAEAGERPRGWRGHRGMMRHGDRGAMIDRMFDRIDADGDGTISPEEFEAAQTRWQERMERRGQRRGG